MQRFSKSGDDSQLQIRLDNAIENNDKNEEGLARQGLYFSRDEVFRSSCLQYLDILGLVNEKDILNGLGDESELVRIEAISIAEYYESDKVVRKLLEVCVHELDEFAVSQIIFALGVKRVDIDLISLKNKWSSSELIQCSLKFFEAMHSPSEKSSNSFFQFLKSGNHIVRSCVVNYSECFLDYEAVSVVSDLLKTHGKSEEYQYIRELIEIRTKEFSIE